MTQAPETSEALAARLCQAWQCCGSCTGCEQVGAPGAAVPTAWSFEEACSVDLVLRTLDQQLLTQLGPEGGEGAFLYLQGADTADLG